MTRCPDAQTPRYTEDMPLLAIRSAPLELNALIAGLGDRGGADGALVTFLGLVRNQLELTLKAVAYNLKRLVGILATQDA